MKVTCYRTAKYQNTDVLEARSIHFQDMGLWPVEDKEDNYVAINLKDGTARFMPHHFIVSIEED